MTQTTSRVLFAILSCHALRHYEQSLRDTWIKEIPEGVDHRFFLGSPNLDYVFSDEVFLSVGDSLQDLTHKTVEMYRWVVEKDYDFVLKVDLDTLVRPLGLLQSDFKQFDWVGGQNSFFASGGAGYTLSRKAMRAVIDHPIELGPAEDVHTAHALAAQGIELHADDRFKFYPGDVMDDRTITFHLSSVKAWDAKATPTDMYSVWADQKARNYRSYAAQQAPQSRPVRFRRLR